MGFAVILDCMSYWDPEGHLGKAGKNVSLILLLPQYKCSKNPNGTTTKWKPSFEVIKSISVQGQDLHFYKKL